MKNIKCYLSNFIKKGLLFILSIFLVFSSVSYRGFTEERYEGGYGGRWTGPVLLSDATLNIDTSVGWNLGGSSYGQEGVMSINGKPVFCLGRQKTYYDGASYNISTEDDFTSVGISWDQAKRFSLISYFAGQRAKENIDWIAVAQSLIWAEQGESRGWINSPTFPNGESVNAAKQILKNDVDNYYVKPSFELSNVTIKVGEIVNYYYLEGGKLFTIMLSLCVVIPVIVRVLKNSMNEQYKEIVVTYDLKIKLLIWVTYYLALSNSRFPERAMSFEVFILNILSIMISNSIVVFLYKLFIEPQPSPEFIAGTRVIGVGRAIRVSEENKDEQNQ